MKGSVKKLIVLLLFTFGIAVIVYSAVSDDSSPMDNASSKLDFPPKLDSYSKDDSLVDILYNRIIKHPFYLIGTIIFLFAIIHTFLSSMFTRISHKWAHEHDLLKKEGRVHKHSHHFGVEVFHFLGEIEVVFGLWSVVLGMAICGIYGWESAIHYFNYEVKYTEPLFVMVIMTLASSRPVLKFSEMLMWRIANLAKGMLISWWFTILTFGPLLGSFITEPAAMTIAAILLGEKFYNLEPSNSFKYATLALLFVNVSVGGTLTHFAAPPVLMVADKWDWGLVFMASNFGWKAAMGIIISNFIYFLFFRKEMERLQEKYAIVRLQRELKAKYIKEDELEEIFERTEIIAGEELGFTDKLAREFEKIRIGLKGRILSEIKEKGINKSLVEKAFDQSFEKARLNELRKTLPGLLPISKRAIYVDPYWDSREGWVPAWVMIVHLGFLIWTVINAHHPPLFIGGFLLFLGFSRVTINFQNRINLKPPLLVGFFLAGLVIHGGVQEWWIEPILTRLSETVLLFGATILTSFNDNAAITLLSTLVKDFSPSLKYAVVAGAVAGGGLTVIANAPNPAGQSILKKFFPDNTVSPARLLQYAIIPTIIMIFCFMFLTF